MTTAALPHPFPPEMRYELARELLREAQHHLSTFERHGRAEDRGRLLQVLDDLALLVRAEPASDAL